MRYRINSPTVIHETIDGETILVNLSTGNYYSLAQSGNEILALLEAGMQLPGIEEALGGRYPGERERVRAAVGSFVDELAREAIIVPRADGPAGAAGPMPSPVPRAELSTFAPPRLQKYEDMQELLLVDPIHEVDETGWPAPRPGSKPGG